MILSILTYFHLNLFLQVGMSTIFSTQYYILDTSFILPLILYWFLNLNLVTCNFYFTLHLTFPSLYLLFFTLYIIGIRILFFLILPIEGNYTPLLFPPPHLTFHFEERGFFKNLFLAYIFLNWKLKIEKRQLYFIYYSLLYFFMKLDNHDSILPLIPIQ